MNDHVTSGALVASLATAHERDMKRYPLLFVMSACFACVALDNSKLVAALPTLARASCATPLLQRWTIEASLLVYASLLLLGGSLSERFGPRRVLLCGLWAFAGASLAGALSGSVQQLIAARACSGVATACITPATLATLKHCFDERARPMAIAVWTASFGVGAAIGPVLSGLLVTRAGHTAVLLANLPPIALCIAGTLALLPADLPRRNLPLDFRGAALCLSAAACCMFAMLSGPTSGWLSPEVLASGLAGAGALLFARSWLRRAPHPLFDLSLFGTSRLNQALAVIFLGYFAFSGVSFVIAQYLQLARAMDPLHAGLISLPLTSSMLLGTLLAPQLRLRWTAERTLGSSLGTASVGGALLACASYGQSDLLLCIALFPFGAGCGCAFATATELTLSSVDQQRAGTAAAISESAFEFGGVVGIAVSSTLLQAAGLGQRQLAEAAPRALWACALAVLFALLLALRSSRRAKAARVTPSACSDP